MLASRSSVLNLLAKLPIAALLLSCSTLAHADVYGALKSGFGSDEYRSHALELEADITSATQLNFDYLLVQSANVDDLRQSGIGLDWDVNPTLSASYHHTKIGDDRVDVSGNEIGLSLELNTLWESDLRTTIGVGYGDNKFTTHRTNIVNPQGLTQSQSMLNISQNITPTFAVYGSHAQYRYDRNVAGLALLLLRRTSNTSKIGLTLLEFPQKTNTAGISWKPSESLNLDLSFGKTVTLLEQRQSNTLLGLDYQLNEKLNLLANVSQSRSTAIIRPNGTTAQAETQDTFTELGAGWAF